MRLFQMGVAVPEFNLGMVPSMEGSNGFSFTEFELFLTSAYIVMIWRGGGSVQNASRSRMSPHDLISWIKLQMKPGTHTLGIVMVHVLLVELDSFDKICPSPKSHTTLFNRFYGGGSWVWFFLSTIYAPNTMSLSSATSIEDCWVEVLQQSSMNLDHLRLKGNDRMYRVDAILKTMDEGIPFKRHLGFFIIARKLLGLEQDAKSMLGFKRYLSIISGNKLRILVPAVVLRALTAIVRLSPS
ncbi:hypothetical protein Tco_0439270 [Tanacetum coccineum]